MPDCRPEASAEPRGLRRQEVAKLAGISVDYYIRPPAVRFLLDSLAETPAYVVDAKYDILAWNALATHFIGDLSTFAEADRHMLLR